LDSTHRELGLKRGWASILCQLVFGFATSYYDLRLNAYSGMSNAEDETGGGKSIKDEHIEEL